MRWLGWLCCVAVAMSCGRRDFNDELDAQIDPAGCTEPPAGCMEPVVYQCGGICYARCRQKVSRAAAAAACAEWGGCLAVAEDQDANDCAASQLAGDLSWIGLMQKTTSSVIADNWEWCDGTPFSFLAWKFGQPDDADGYEDGTENCALIHADGTWSDEGCALPEPFVCSR